MRVADYIFDFLAERQIGHVFLVTGGGAMFLNDALRLEKRIKYVCNLHEQACAIAAEGYARVSGRPGVICVTTGPGGTNALTGVVGAWLDSIPMLIISGQVKTSTALFSCPELNLRQLGDQELNIVDVVRPVTKYAITVTEPEAIVEELQKAWNICQQGRPGPVWLDIPLDIQSAELNTGAKEIKNSDDNPASAAQIKDEQIEKIVDVLTKSERPALLVGGGVRNADGIDDLLCFAEKCNIPVLTAISGIDLISSDHPLFFGRPGILGERAANFIMQNSDTLLIIGARMGIRMIGYAFGTVARKACKIMVDIDGAELEKPTFKPDIKVNADAGVFIRQIAKALPELPVRTAWMEYCRRMKNSYPVVLPEHRNREDYVSSYYLPELIVRECRDDAIVVTANGCAYTSTFQGIPVKRGMRIFANQGCASMGYGLPAAIGAAFAADAGREVICITGDGSIQMNLQELQTVVSYNLVLKIFVYNNQGYQSIKMTQKAFFNGGFIGSTAESGVTLPDLEKVAATYNLPFYRLNNNREAEKHIADIINYKGAVLVEVMTDPFEVLSPKAASWKQPDGTMVSAPLEDLAPFLSREEFRQNMLIED